MIFLCVFRKFKKKKRKILKNRKRDGKTFKAQLFFQVLKEFQSAARQVLTVVTPSSAHEIMNGSH